jgi:hypothetical protein
MGASRGNDQRARRPGHGGPSVTPDVAAAAKEIVAGDASVRVAARAVDACEQLSQPLARLVGSIGTRVLLARSAALASARFPWLSGTIPVTAPRDAPWAALQAAMEAKDPHTAGEAFAELLSTFVELLERLIGDALVAHLLHEV